MSEKYKIRSSGWPYFVTISVVRWIDVFTRPVYKNIFVDSLNYCVEQKGLVVHAWVLMPNHAHLLIDTKNEPIENIMRDFKRHTSKAIIKEIEDNIQESRDWMMYFFRKAGSINSMNKHVQFWQNGYHPIHCWNNQLIMQKLNYIHQNPVRAEYVNLPHDWKYSSASDYALGHGLVQVEKLDPYII
jgi:putative transposase